MVIHTYLHISTQYVNVYIIIYKSHASDRQSSRVVKKYAHKVYV